MKQRPPHTKPVDARRLVLDCFRVTDECDEKELGRRLRTVKDYVDTLALLMEEGLLVRVAGGYRITAEGRRALQQSP